MKIAEVSIARPIFASMVIMALVVFGMVSYGTMGVDLFPDVDFPIVTVSVAYEGADPETVETEVTDVIEEAVNTISGIKTLRSESSEGFAQVFIEFELEEDINVVSQDVRDKVAAVRADLPREIESPIVEKFDPDSSPILAVVLSGSVSVGELSDFADDVVKRSIEGVPGVGSVRLVGQREREIRIWLRIDAMRAHGLAAKDVIDSLRKENVEPPGGRVETDSREIIVKTKGKIATAAEFGDLVIATRNQVPTYLRDVAWIEDGLEDFRSLARLNGKRAVSLLIRRQSGSNMLAVAEEVKHRLSGLEANLPVGYNLTIAQDLSRFVDDSFTNAKDELFRGGLLAVVVIIFFLRSFRGSFIAAITIPTTIISTITFMSAMGFTLNMMSMLALTISVGMIIDDTIVVLENSHRHMEAGSPRRRAAREAIAEIGFAVIATSLAIGAVFIPVAFMSGLVGRFFYEFGLTVAFAVAVSTFIAVTLSPMLCSRLLSVTTEHGRIFRALERFFEGLEAVYRTTLRIALHHRLLVLTGAVAVFLAGLAITPFLGKEFIPAADEDQFNIQVETPIGTSIDATSNVLAEIESRVQRLPGVTDTFMTIGAAAEGRVNYATIMTKLQPKADRDLSQQDIMLLAREQLADLTHLKISVEQIPRVSGGGFRSAPLQYVVRGADLDRLIEVSDQVAESTAKVPGIVDVNSSYDAGKPEVNVVINRDRAADLGVSVEDLGKAIRTLIGGEEVTKFEEGGETYDVRVRLAEIDRKRPDSILSVPVRTSTGQYVELRNLIRVEEKTGPVQIDREDRMRQVTVFGNLEPTKPLGAALADVRAIEAEIGLPEGVESAFSGEGDMMAESFASIGFSMVLAAILIYMVLAAQFESLIHPFTVMLSLPLSIVGALGLLFLTGRTLSIFAMIGMIMLMGLVTKNAILLVDYTNLLRSQGMGKTEALMAAGPVRLRPILMTAFSTVAGMLPVAIGLGSGAETRAPMGTAIVGGMVTSTILTLVVIPVMYSVMDDVAGFLRRLIFRTKAPADSADRQVPIHERAVLAEAGSKGDGNGEPSRDVHDIATQAPFESDDTVQIPSEPAVDR
jgi:HAE1 family hydrophobic/amphiphilic exporter-1